MQHVLLMCLCLPYYIYCKHINENAMNIRADL